MDKEAAYNDSSIVLRLTTKGKYHWAIKISFNTDAPNIDQDTVISAFTSLDRKLKDKFPNNTTLQVNSAHFSRVDEFSDDLDL